MEDIYYNILLHLPVKDIVKCRLVNKVFCRIINSESLWQNIYHKNFSHTNLLKTNYRDECKLYTLLQILHKKLARGGGISHIKLYTSKELALVNKTITIPTELGILENLTIMWITNTGNTIIPTELGKLIKLRRICLDNNEFATFPTEFGQLNDLQSFHAFNNGLDVIPTELGQLTNLYSLLKYIINIMFIMKINLKSTNNCL